MLLHIILVVLALLLLSDYLLKNYNKDWRMLGEIPGPKAIPIIGNLLLFRDRSQRGMWITHRKLSDMYYPILKGWAFNLAFVSIRHPDDLEVVLSHPKATCKEYPYKYLRAWMKTGLFTKRGDTLKCRRRMLTPAFHFSMLRSYMDIMNKHSDIFIAELKNKSEEFVGSMLHFYSDVSLNIILESAMGIELGKNTAEITEEYKKAIETIGYFYVYRITRPYISDWIFNLLHVGQQQNAVIRKLHALTNKIIAERREYHRINNTNLLGYKEFTENLEKDSENIYTTGHKRKLRMLDILLAAEKDGLIDADGIRDEVDTFLVGGFDTTRMTLFYFTSLMAENKDIQDRARAEVVSIFEQSGGEIGMTELQQMSYLEQCIKETLRLYPIGPIVSRTTTDYIKLKNYTIPPNVIIVCNIIDVQRDANFWKEPMKFDPDRFSPERSRNRHPFSYLPFAAGPRNCIGQKFAWLEMRGICSRILYNFYLEPVNHTSDMKMIGDLILRPEDPFYTKFIRINRE